MIVDRSGRGATRVALPLAARAPFRNQTARPMYGAGMLRRLLQARREARDRVLKDPGGLLTFMGEPA